MRYKLVQGINPTKSIIQRLLYVCSTQILDNTSTVRNIVIQPAAERRGLTNPLEL